MGDVTPFLVSSLLSDCRFRSKTSFLSQSFASFCLPQTGFTLTFKVLLFSLGEKKKILTGNLPLLLSQIFFTYFIHMILYIEISKYVYVNGREKKNNELTFHQHKKLKCLPLFWWHHVLWKVWIQSCVFDRNSFSINEIKSVCFGLGTSLEVSEWYPSFLIKKKCYISLGLILKASEDWKNTFCFMDFGLS